jgi:hypothetical protein
MAHAEVRPGRVAVLEFPAPGALAVFIWTFADSTAGTKISQEANRSGPEALSYIETFGRALEQGIPAGMRKLCEAMESAQLAQSANK